MNTQPTVPSFEVEVTTIGRSMPRERRQNGWVEKTGVKAKTWTGYWYVYETVDGVERRLRRRKVLGNCSELTKGAAEDKLHELIREDRPPETGATFGEIARWYLKTNSGRWSKKWNATSQGMFKHQILPRLGHKVAADLKRSEIQQAINDIAEDPTSQSKSVVNKCLTHIRAVFNAAIEDEVLEKNPALKAEMPPSRRPSGRFLTLEECQRLLEVCGRRDHLILRLFMVDGFRPSELFALRVNDVEPGRLRIDQTAVPNEPLKDRGKTEESLGFVPMPPELEAEILAYISAENITDFLFPSAVGKAMSHDNYLDRVLKPLGVLAGIDVYTHKNGRQTSKLNHQVLRRTTGTHFQSHGEIKDTQTLLRHDDAATTLKHYQKVLPESLKTAVNSWDTTLVPKKRPGRQTPGRLLQFPKKAAGE